MPRPPTLPSWGTTGGTRVEPSGGKKASGFSVSERPPARFFNWLFGVSSDWITWFDGLLNGTQAFTGDRLAFSGTDAEEPILWTTTKPIDDPADATNDWKSLLGFRADALRFVNHYVGKGSGGVPQYAIVSNASWDVGTQLWVQDDVAKPTLALLWAEGVFRVSGQPAGAADWGSWPTNPASISTAINGQFSVLGTTQLFDDVSIPTGDLAVGGEVAAGTLDVAGIGVFGDTLSVDGDFLYVTPATQNKSVPLSCGVGGAGAGFTDDVAGGAAFWVLDPGEMVSFPIEVPHAATTISSRVKLLSTAGTTYKLDAQRSVFNFAAASLPTVTNEDTTSGTATAATVINPSVDFTALTATKVDTLHIRIENTGGANQLLVYGVEKTFVDPGPRNV